MWIDIIPHEVVYTVFVDFLHVRAAAAFRCAGQQPRHVLHTCVPTIAGTTTTTAVTVFRHLWRAHLRRADAVVHPAWCVCGGALRRKTHREEVSVMNPTVNRERKRRVRFFQVK